MTAVIGLAPVAASRRTVCVLGTFDLVVDGTSRFVGDAGATLVALLALTAQRSREQVQGTLWPDCHGGQASGRLRSLLYRVRRVAGEDMVQSVGSHTLRIAPDVNVDYWWAREVVHEIGSPHRFGRGEDSRLGVAPNVVVDLLGRDLLPSVQAEWCLPHRWAWSRARLSALVTYAHQRAELGDWIGASAAAESVLASEPFNEPAHYLLILALLRDGFANTARQMYEALAAQLRAELGCAPTRSYQELLGRAHREFAAR
jgi:DNA-binding SARP family transcriptional activator